MSKFAIYAGHGGKDPGAVSTPGSAQPFRKEKDFTLNVMLETTKLLRNAGHTVMNNRTTDADRSISADANAANNAKVDALVEIHLNSNSGTPGTGCETYYVDGSTKGKALALAVNNEVAAISTKNRGIKTANFSIIKKTTAPAVLVETAFINNDDDMAKYDCTKMAKAIANGVMSIYGGSAGNNQNGSSNSNSNTTNSGATYLINVTAASGLNVRSGPGTTYSIKQALPKSNVKYTIVEEKNGWGKLKSGAGWVCLKYTKKVD